MEVGLQFLSGNKGVPVGRCSRLVDTGAEASGSTPRETHGGVAESCGSEPSGGGAVVYEM